MSRKLKFSVNLNLIDKNPPDNKLDMSRGFVSVEDTIEKLAEIISNEGWAFSFQFNQEHRSTVNFLATDILSVDIDGGLTIEDALKNPIVQKYGSLLYTTVSHTPDNHRFRVPALNRVSAWLKLNNPWASRIWFGVIARVR